MKSLRSYLLESNFPAVFMRTVFSALPLMEACNINKDFLVREAGSPESFAEAKGRVQALWKQETMDAQLNQKAAQKVLNLLYLMEIRQPGFTTADKLHRIHDLALANLLDTKFLNMVSSDTTPGEADSLLADAEERKERNDKLYPDLTAEDERIWNRVKVYHEFPDGFKWVYAVDDLGHVVGYMPSRITAKTMHHCGNEPSNRAGNEYWELRGPDGRAYLTVILDGEGRIEESKSWGNQVNKYRTMIQPYVKWFLMNRATGVGTRYNYGYATGMNYGVKDFIAEDPGFVEYVIENKPELIGNSEGRILFWKGALEDGVLDVDGIKRMYAQGVTFNDLDGAISEYSGRARFGKYITGDPKEDLDTIRRNRWGDISVFGQNGFSIVCSACGGCPFSRNELYQLIESGRLKLEEFANYDIKLLDDDMQRVFVAAKPSSYDQLVTISSQVATFHISEGLVDSLVSVVENPGFDFSAKEPSYGQPTYDEFCNKLTRWSSALRRVLEYMAVGNPPEKVHRLSEEKLPVMVDALVRAGDLSVLHSMVEEFSYVLKVLARFPDIQMPRPGVMWPKVGEMLVKGEFPTWRGEDAFGTVLEIGRPRVDPLFERMNAPQMLDMCQDRSMVQNLDVRGLVGTCRHIAKLIDMYPEVLPLIRKSRRPAVKLGVYCFGGTGICTEDEAIGIAQGLYTKPRENGSVLGAASAAVIAAMGRLDGFRESLDPGEVMWYLYNRLEQFNYRTPHIMDIFTDDLIEYLFEYAEKLVDSENDEPYDLRLSLRVIDQIGNMDNSYGDRLAALMAAAMYRHPGSLPRGEVERGRVKVRYDDWGRYADKMGMGNFIDSYVLKTGWWYNPDGLDDFPLNFILDYLLSVAGKKYADNSWLDIIRSNCMKNRRVKKRLSELLMERLESGKADPSEMALSSLNGIGLITKQNAMKFLKARDSDKVARGEVAHAGDAESVGKLTGNMDRLVGSKSMPRIIDEMLSYYADPDNVLNPALLKKLVSWCTRNAKTPGVAEAVRPESIDPVIARVTADAGEAKTEYDGKKAYNDEYGYHRSLFGSWDAENRARKLAEEVYPDLLGALNRCRERCLKNSPQLSLKI